MDAQMAAESVGNGSCSVC